jgi:hypothetical protein
MELLADREVRRALAAGAALIMVPVVRDIGRPKKANVSMDAGALQAIDEEAAAHDLTARPSLPARRWRRSAAGPEQTRC